jgi:regulator of replication initiation timing
MSETGLKNEYQVGKILVSGSLALKEKNTAGLRVFEESDTTDGIISGKLIRPKYNVTELKKSIDTTIFELIPQSAPILEDTVLRRVYNPVTQSVIDLTLQVEDLTLTVLNLRSRVSELQIVSESLRIEVDNEKLKASVSENQAIIANGQIATTTIDLQNSIQNSINEAIQRVSLTARNEALLQENTSLREQLFGQTAQLSAGADALSATVAVNSLQKEASLGDIYGAAKKERNGGFQSFRAGQKWEVVNSGTDSINITLTKGGDSSWFNATPTTFSVPAGGRKEFQLSANRANINERRPTGLGDPREYAGTLTVNLSGGKSIILNAKLRKTRN